MRKLKLAVEVGAPTKRFRAQIVRGLSPEDMIPEPALNPAHPVHQQLQRLQDTFGAAVPAVEETLTETAEKPATHHVMIRTEPRDPTQHPKCDWWQYPLHVQEALIAAHDAGDQVAVTNIHKKHGPHHMKRR